MALYFEGLVFGIVPVFFVGPVLFTLLDASLRGGFAAGVLVASGIAASDVCAVALCALGVGPLLTQPWGQWVLSVAGGLILAGFGVVMLLGAAKPREAPSAPASGTGLFARGFLVNFVNPFVFTFWIGAIGGVAARHGYAAATLGWFFAGTVTTILITDLLKARLAHALRPHLSGAAVRWAQRISGVLLGGYGLFLLGKALVQWSSLPETTTLSWGG